MKDGARKFGKATARGAALFGMRAEDVIVVANAVEVGGAGAPGTSFDVIGIAGDAAMRESRVRVRAALTGLGIDLAGAHVMVRVGTADGADAIGGAALDLPVAAAVLGALGEVPAGALDGTLFAGELTLDGIVRGVRGILPMIAGGGHFARFVVPGANEGEAAFGAAHRVREEGSRGERDVRVAGSLAELRAALRGEAELPRAELRAASEGEGLDVADVADPAARRALEIAAAGGHGMLLVGPPGAGKTMIARRLPTLLPAMATREAFEVSAVRSAAGMLGGGKSNASDRPFRAPHHTVSDAGLVGGGGGSGGAGPRPGEASLAHGGVLFLDELPEFRRAALESLASVVRDGEARFLRTSREPSSRAAAFPARPIVVGAMNACPCGYRGLPGDRCTCAEARVNVYGKRADAMRGFFDLEIRVRTVDFKAAREPGESSEVVRARVARARERQAERQARLGLSSTLNGKLSAAEAERVVGGAASLARFPSRGSAKVWRVARTIADLAASEEVTAAHLAEAAEFVGKSGES